uniref:RNA binding motif protein 5 n=1 Tax=Scleropages formosus TaxID=113540 RepID=A0A8C9TNL1_SCLFO
MRNSCLISFEWPNIVRIEEKCFSFLNFFQPLCVCSPFIWNSGSRLLLTLLILLCVYRVSRTERSGRYGPDSSRDDGDWRDRRDRDMEREYDSRRWGDERRSDRYEGERCRQESPEVKRKRRNSDRSEDGYHSDGDYPDQDYRGEPGEEKESKTIMLRGLSLQVTEAEVRAAIDQLEGPKPADVRLMKKRTGISRGFAFVEFYHLQDATRWMETNQKLLVIQGKTVAMQYSNPRHKFEDWLCNTCGLYNFRRRLKCFRCGAAKVGKYAISRTIILRNIAPLTTVEAIMAALAPYANLSASNIRLIKDKQTGQNRGFAFVQLSSPLEASQLLMILQGLQPPLKLDGKTIGVDYAKSARKDLVLPDGNRVNALSVASTAIAAAQWSSSQPQHSGDGVLEYNYLQEGFPPYAQVSSNNTCDLVYLSEFYLIFTVLLGNDHFLSSSVVPDTSTYQYDESSGYYYDPQTGLYYDPNTQYYYNSQTQQYLYWDSEKQSYIPAADNGSAQASSASSSTAATTKEPKEPKEKKEKPKSKTAQQIAKDMERWAKSLNKQKENFKSSFQPVSQEERKEAAAADAGFSLFEKKAGILDKPQLVAEPMKNNDEENQAKVGLVAAYRGDSDPEEAEPERNEEGADKLTDWKKMACLLCRRQFPNKEALVRHQQLSDLHKQNIEVYKRSRLSQSELEDLERKETEAQLRTKGAGLGTKGSSYTLSASDTYKDAVRKAMFARFTEIE